MRHSCKSILGMEFGWSNADLEECRYHYGRTNKPVYVIGNDYYCAAKIGQKPAKHQDGIQWEWKEYKSSFAEKQGWQIWVSEG